MLDSFNIAAANADYNGYFNYFDEDGVFMGTDATEHWNKAQFMVWAKPFFDRKKPGILHRCNDIFLLILATK
jgi:hypothetical protein